MGYHVVAFGFFTGLIDNMAFYCQPKSVFFLAHPNCIQIDFSESGKQEVQGDTSADWLVMFGCANRSNSDRMQS